MRTDAKLTMGELARRMGTSVVFISKVENEKSPPLTRERILQFAAIVEADPTPLLVAAGERNGSFQIPYFTNPTAQRVAAFLMRADPNVSDEDLRTQFETQFETLFDGGGSFESVFGEEVDDGKQELKVSNASGSEAHFTSDFDFEAEVGSLLVEDEDVAKRKEFA